MLKKIRLGIMGLGEHCLRAHIKHLIKDSRIVIVSAFDPSHESIKKFKEYSPETFVTTNEEDFWLHEIDAVIIASPDQFHGLQLKKAIEKNLHVFCEKPMAVSFKDLNILRTAINIAEEKKLVLATCHPRRLDPPFIWLKEQLINGSLFQSIGKVLHFDFTFWYLKISDNPEDAWKKKRSLLSDHFGHEIDLFAFLFPHEIKEITAKKISDSYRQYEVVGKTASLLSFKFLGLRTLDDVFYDEVLRIDAEKGSWILNLSKGIMIQLPTMNITKIPCIDYDIRFNDVNKNFIDTILGVAENYLTHKDILRNNTMSVELDKSSHSIF